MGSHAHPEIGRQRRLHALVVANVAYAAALVALAVSPQVPGSSQVSDRLAHALAYGFQAMLLIGLFAYRLSFRRAVLTGCICATAFGVVTEALQLLQPTRSTEIMDVVADASGAIAAGALAALVQVARSGVGRGA